MTPISPCVLAIDPSSRGFGFAVLAAPSELVDAGFRHTRDRKNLITLSEVERFLRRIRPVALVLEDIEARGARRQIRVRQLLESLAGLARTQGIPVRRISRKAVLAHFAEGGGTTKQAVASLLAARFPELRDRLPAPRKIWQGERDSLAIFDALALAVTATVEGSIFRS